VTGNGETARPSLTAASGALGNGTSEPATNTSPSPIPAQNIKPAIPHAALQALVALGSLGSISLLGFCVSAAELNLAGLSVIFAIALIYWRRKKQIKAKARNFQAHPVSRSRESKSLTNY
jgi:hypothetical protein